MLIRVGNRVRVLSAPRLNQQSPKGVIGVVCAEARSLDGHKRWWILPDYEGETPPPTVTVFSESDSLERWFY
jgi:hypothetical protein